MANVAVYAGTFDPITNGHLDVIERAARLFDRVMVAVAFNTSKQSLFALDERIALAQEALKHLQQVEVHGFSSLLIDFARQHHANVILRGLRTGTDFDYEFQLAGMNRHLNAAIETVFLMPSEKHLYISSSLVREIAMLDGDVSGFVSPSVQQALQQKRQMRQK